ncbi:hypothetical protein R80B4_02634 [Fibrobacteres bacterium R8-0-B4]
MVQALGGTAQLRAFIHVAVAEAHFTQNDVVARFYIAFHRETTDKHLLFFCDDVAHVQQWGAVVGFDHPRVHFGESVAVIGVIVRQAFGIFLHDGQGEIFVRLLVIVHFDHVEHILFAVYDIAGKFDVSDSVAPVSYTHLDVYKRQV